MTVSIPVILKLPPTKQRNKQNEKGKQIKILKNAHFLFLIIRRTTTLILSSLDISFCYCFLSSDWLVGGNKRSGNIILPE